ncbi:hypothetical protein J4729_13340 [Leisingera sp. HS039]|uniref:3TM-type holin n=1 Tax=unclassified Leisingera TaxID=2614906 RepID=UPI001070F465|nr:MULTISPECIES: 3TM-type holin [unclassified Leisingera]MBQ4825526.1 hypothetical protein [Leisingera sp. HS039]QBR35092.1 hypothetical protein ETW23_01865 [Leisingera sp. NJS201]
MGLIKWLIGGGAEQIGATVERVGGFFRPNAEASAARAHDIDAAALSQYAAEFQAHQQRTCFDSLMDSLNRMVRPVITLTVLGVIPAVMLWPEQMAVTFAALALLPTGYWALVSVITGFYYGGRMQLKAQDFERSVSDAVARAPQVIENMRRLRDHLSPGEAEADDDPRDGEENAAVAAWKLGNQI